MSLTRDRELADLLYNSYGDLSLLLADLSSLAEHQTQHAVVAVANHDHDKHTHDGHAPAPSEAQKTLTSAQKKTVALQQHLVQIIKLLIQNHTDASIIINEFEKIRTSKLLMSETFALAHVIPVHGGDQSHGTPLLK
jgi:hypothetical protein